jgi:hypothetical protein
MKFTKITALIKGSFFKLAGNKSYLLLKKLKLYTLFYHFKKDINIKGNTIFYIVNDNVQHAGLVDRFKVIVSAYYIAKNSNFNFKIVFTNPFNLRDFLAPNNYDWRSDEEDISYCYRQVRILTYEKSTPKLRKEIEQYHIYVGKDLLIEYFEKEKAHKEWGQLYRELFQPSTKLLTIINSKLKEINDQYYAIHLRFVNAFGDFEDVYNNRLNDEGKKTLISKCNSKINELAKQYNKFKFLICSDSQYFLDQIKTNKNVIVLDGKLGHITFNGKDESVTSKVFLDFYLLSKAQRVFSFSSPEMYEGSGFAPYASYIGEIPYEKIYL